MPPVLQHAVDALAGQQWASAAAGARAALSETVDAPAQALACLTLARACWHLGDLVECCRQALRAEQLARQSADGPTVISAATLLAFALTELDLAEHALPLAQQALLAAEQAVDPSLLPTALSCAAHVHARLHDLERAEGLHMRALSHAREAHDVAALQLAYDNLLLSFIFMHRAAEAVGDTAGAQAVARRSGVYVSHIRSLLDEPRLDAWRRISLMHHLGELLSLCGDNDEAERLLRGALAQAARVDARYSALEAQTALAELLCRRQSHAAALACLGDGMAAEAVGRAGMHRQMLGLQIALACHRALGQPSQATAVLEHIEAVQAVHGRMREDARHNLPKPT